MTYADSRPHVQVDELRSEITEDELHQLTGTRAHTSYWPARLRWLRAERPDVMRRAAHFLSLGDYVLRVFTGQLVTGTATAAWTGMVDLRTADWSDGRAGDCGHHPFAAGTRAAPGPADGGRAG